MFNVDGGELVQKVAISGPVLASIMNELCSCSADVDGLLFGRVSRRMVTNLCDDNEPSLPHQECIAHITGFCCPGRPMSFYNGVGQVDFSKLHSIMLTRESTSPSSDPPIGWFLIRRNSPLRPSMREVAVCANLSAVKPDCPGAIPTFTPCLFSLFTSFSCDARAIHTYDYRFFQHLKVLDDNSAGMAPRPVSIVNLGPAFRGQYDSFAPVSAVPLLLYSGEELPSSGPRGSAPSSQAQDHSSKFHQSQQQQGGGGGLAEVVGDHHHSALSNSGRSDGARSVWTSLGDGRREEEEEEGGAQAILDRVAQGYSVNSLRLLTELSCKGHVAEMEALYNRMLAKLEDVAHQVGNANTILMQKLELIERLKATPAGSPINFA